MTERKAHAVSPFQALPHSWRDALYAGAAYFLAVIVSILIHRFSGNLAVVWLANALGLTFVLRQAAGAWPVTFVAIFVAGTAGIAAMEGPVLLSAGVMVGNTIEILVAALAIRRYLDEDFHFGSSLAAYFQVQFIAGVAAPVFGALIGATLLMVVQGNAFLDTAWFWWSGRAIGVFVVLPIALSISQQQVREAFTGRKLLEFAGFGGLVIIASYLAVAFLKYPFAGIVLLLSAAAMRLNPLATACLSAVGFATVVAVGLAGSFGVPTLDISLVFVAALSVIMPFAISLLIAELRRDRADVADSEKRFRTTMDKAPIGMAIVGLDGSWVRLNPAVCELLGYSEDELKARTFQELTHADDLDADVGLVRRAIAGEIDSYRMEKRYIRKDGSIVWALLAVAIMRDETTRKPLYFISQIEDITARKEAEARLADAESRWSFALEGARQGVWDHDYRKGTAFYSAMWKAILGYDPHEIDPDPEMWKALIHPDDLPRILAIDAEHMAGRMPFVECEFRMRHKDGHWVWIHDRGKVVERDAAGVPLRMIGTHTDVTDRKTQEARVEAAENRWNFALESAQQGVWDHDLRTGATYYSPTWKAILGYVPDELRDEDLDWKALVHPDDLADALAANIAHRRSITPYLACEFRMRHKDGRWVWILDRGKVIERDADGNPLRMIGTHTDISAQKAAGEEIARLSRRMQAAVSAGRIGLWELDPETGDTWWDPGVFTLFGMPPEKAADDALFKKLIHPGDVERIYREIDTAMRQGTPHDSKFRVIRPDGETRHIRVLALPLFDGTESRRMLVGANWDVTETQNLTEALFEEKERLRVTLESIRDAVICTDTTGRITFFNPVAEAYTGFPAAEVYTVFEETSGKPMRNVVDICLTRTGPASSEGNVVMVDRRGGSRAISDGAAPMMTAAGEVLGSVLVFQDISEARRMQRELERTATHDTLTGLRNRLSFDRDLQAVCNETPEGDRSNILCYIDLDRFKAVNDTAGHAAGDALLRQVGDLLRLSVRAQDTIARLGGDEFGLLLRDCPLWQAETFAETLVKQISSEAFMWQGAPFRIGACIGLRVIPPGAGPGSVLVEADMACYAAKARGRNRVAVYGRQDFKFDEALAG